jgi:hypothetical protein
MEQLNYIRAMIAYTMKRIFSIIFILVLIFPARGLSIDLGEIGKTLEKAGAGNILESAGIDLNKITDYLNWETINVSLISDYSNITNIKGKKVLIDGKVYKSGLNAMRIDLKSGLEVPGKDTKRLTDCYVLYRLLKKQGYLVFPRRKAFIEIDPDEVHELLGALHKKRDGKPKIEKKEVLGMEAVDEYTCKKVYALMRLPNGTKNNITMWLAQDLKGFPVKIVADFLTPRGLTGTNTTLFTNIQKTEPNEALFVIPKDFIKYKNLVEVATKGKLGSHLKKRAK